MGRDTKTVDGMRACTCGCGRVLPLTDYNFYRKIRKTKSGSLVEKLYAFSYSKECHNRINKEMKAKRDPNYQANYLEEYWKTYKRRPPGEVKRLGRRNGITQEEKLHATIIQ